MRCKLCDGPCLIFQGKFWKCEHCDELSDISVQLNDDGVQLDEETEPIKVKINTLNIISSPDWIVNLNDKICKVCKNEKVACACLKDRKEKTVNTFIHDTYKALDREIDE